MITAPITATIEPIISYLSGFFLSIILPQMIADIMKIPPYAAYTLPNSAGCSVGIIPYTKRMIPPKTPSAIVFFSLNHSQTRYPPPISAMAAAKNSANVTGGACIITSASTRWISPLLFLACKI